MDPVDIEQGVIIMKHMIRYKLTADRVAENERYAVAVYDELGKVKRRDCGMRR